MDLILHIGNHKTGSTAIQSVLAANYKLLKDNEILYPQSGIHAGAHHKLVAEFKIKKEDSFKKFLGEQDNTDIKEGTILSCLEDELRIVKPKVVIISSEELFNVKNIDADMIRSFISKFDSIKIVCYLRNQIEHIESSYKFSVVWKNEQEKRAFSEYLSIQLASPYHSYINTLNYWSAFNNVEMIVLPFDELKSNLISSFFNAVNLKKEFGLIDTKRISRNKSKPKDIVKIYRQLNKRNFDYDKIEELANRLIELTTKERTSGLFESFYTYEQFIKVRDKFKSSNQEINDIFKLNLNKYTPDPKDILFEGRLVKISDLGLVNLLNIILE